MVQNLDPKLALKMKLEHRAQQNHEHHWFGRAWPAQCGSKRWPGRPVPQALNNNLCGPNSEVHKSGAGKLSYERPGETSGQLRGHGAEMKTSIRAIRSQNLRRSLCLIFDSITPYIVRLRF